MQDKTFTTDLSNNVFYYASRGLLSVLVGLGLFTLMLFVTAITGLDTDTAAVMLIFLWLLAVICIFSEQLGFVKKLIAYALCASVYEILFFSGLFLAAVYLGSLEENGLITLGWYQDEPWAALIHCCAFYGGWRTQSWLLRSFRGPNAFAVTKPPHLVLLNRLTSQTWLIGDARTRLLWLLAAINLYLVSNLHQQIEMLKEHMYRVPDEQNEYMKQLETQKQNQK